MYATKEQLYETVYNIVLNCGNIHNWKEFSINILNTVASSCPFDQARIYFLNGNGKIEDQYLLGIDKKWVNAYHDYYSKILDNRYGIRTDINERMLPPTAKINKRSWNGIATDEFIQDYIKPLGLKHSLGFWLFDADGSPKTQIMLDRTSTAEYSPYEMEVLRLAYEQLNNLHKNFFSNCNSVNKLENVNWKTTNLTAREIDVTTLLCQGVSPSNIGKKLHIAQPTVNKHISHIYAKMQVSNRQELLVRILNQ